MFVPVISKEGSPLMPTRIGRAKRWNLSKKGTFFWNKGILCIRLNDDPSDRKFQQVVVGIDPGSKREGYTVKSKAHTYLNILSETPCWIKDAIEARRNMRRARRFRNTRRRECRFDNRHKLRLQPSTKARWQLKLNICKKLLKVFPIVDFVIEDISAITKSGHDKWNKSFSPLEVGKKWFYCEISKLGKLVTKQGYETKQLRDSLGLKKDSDKLSDNFYTHNIDSWVLANQIVGGHLKPDNCSILKIVPLRFHRRQLHVFQPEIGGKRRNYGGTMSLGLKRGSLINHKKYGIVYVGGSSNNRISVHNRKDGKRIAQNVKTCDCKFLSFSSLRSEFSNSFH